MLQKLYMCYRKRVLYLLLLNSFQGIVKIIAITLKGSVLSPFQTSWVFVFQYRKHFMVANNGTLCFEYDTYKFWDKVTSRLINLSSIYTDAFVKCFSSLCDFSSLHE